MGVCCIPRVRKGPFAQPTYMYISLSWYPQSLHHLCGTQNVAKPCFLLWVRNVVAAGSEPALVDAMAIADELLGSNKRKQAATASACCSSVADG